MFYTFRQNNSGGSFSFDAELGISHIVIIEADDKQEAIDKAAVIGLYFDGVENDYDCECCGDRWDIPYDDGTDVPRQYKDDEEIKPYSKFAKKDFISKWMKGPEGFIHYKDGTFKPFWE